MNQNQTQTLISEGEQAILKRLTKGPIPLRWGRSGWVADQLPRKAKRADFDALCKRHDQVFIEMGQLKMQPATEHNENSK